MIDLKDIRTEKGLTQQQLADEVGVGRTTIAMIECGNSKPSIKTAIKLGTALNLDWTLFFLDAMSLKVDIPQERGD